MNKLKKATVLCYKALSELNLELSKQGEIIADRNQMLTFKAHLEKISWQLEEERLPPKAEREFGMGQAIIDSWPLSSQLGNLLCSAEQAYRQL